MKRLIIAAALVCFAAANASGHNPGHSSYRDPGFRYVWLEDNEYYRPRINASLDVDMWFDNRELKSDYSKDLTYFGLMARPLLSLHWGKGNSLFAGGTLTLDFGDRDYRRDPEVNVYYRYEDPSFSAYAGVFPRSVAMGDYPSMFFSGSTHLYDRNLEGALLQYRGRLGYVEAAVDWLSMIHDDNREKFVVFSSGKITTGNRKFHAGYYASMFHYSVSDNDDGVVDNLLAYPYVGFQLSSGRYAKGEYQLFSVNAGWAQAMQRDRKNENKWLDPGGFQGSVRFERWKWGVENIIYIGENLMPLFDRYDTRLYQGTDFYRTEKDIYNRTELFWTPVHDEAKKLKIRAIFHYDGKSFGSQQLVTFSLTLNRKTIGRW